MPYARFRDVQVRGPLKDWEHIHGFAAQSRDSREGTLITDEIRYTVGLSALGRLVEKSVIRMALAYTFAHRRRVIGKLLAGGNA